jgi:replicative DNA helicase
LIIVAARPGAGKTTAAITIGTQLASRGNGVVFFSLEMGAKQIQYKSISCLDFLNLREQGALVNPIRVSNIKNRLYTKEQIERIRAINASALNEKFRVLEGNHSVSSIIATVKTLCRTRTDMRAIIIDYLQLIPDCREGSLNEASAIGEVTRALKLAAREAKIDIFLLSQVNRGVEQRTEKIPTLADLRASGRIEEDADIVMFLYRPYYYDPAADPGEMTISLAKNRNGITGLINCRVDLASSVVYG